jgi:hypothetical protein
VLLVAFTDVIAGEKEDVKRHGKGWGKMDFLLLSIRK